MQEQLFESGQIVITSSVNCKEEDKMETNIEFTEAQEAQLDALYNAADDLLTLLNPKYEHDMALCGDLVDAAQGIIEDSFASSCYPYMTEGKDGCDVRCDFDKCVDGTLACKFASCPFARNNAKQSKDDVDA